MGDGVSKPYYDHSQSYTHYGRNSVLETIHTIFCIIFLYWYLVANFGDANNGVDRIHWYVSLLFEFESNIKSVDSACRALRVSGFEAVFTT